MRIQSKSGLEAICAHVFLGLKGSADGISTGVGKLWAYLNLVCSAEMCAVVIMAVGNITYNAIEITIAPFFHMTHKSFLLLLFYFTDKAHTMCGQSV